MIVFKKSPVRGFTPVELPPEKPDYSAIDYNRSVMYKDILVKKQLKYYRDTKGVYHMGTITEQDDYIKYKSDDSLVNLDPLKSQSKDKNFLSHTELDYYINLFKNPATFESGIHDL